MNRLIILFCFCVLTWSVADAQIGSVDYASVMLDEGQATYVALPLYKVAAQSGNCGASIGGMASSALPSYHFGSTSVYVTAERASARLLTGSATTLDGVGKRRVNPNKPPLDPFPDPVGEVPFVLMLLLGGVWALVRRRKTA